MKEKQNSNRIWFRFSQYTAQHCSALFELEWKEKQTHRSFAFPCQRRTFYLTLLQSVKRCAYRMFVACQNKIMSVLYKQKSTYSNSYKIRKNFTFYYFNLFSNWVVIENFPLEYANSSLNMKVFHLSHPISQWIVNASSIRCCL